MTDHDKPVSEEERRAALDAVVGGRTLALGSVWDITGGPGRVLDALVRAEWRVKALEEHIQGACPLGWAAGAYMDEARAWELRAVELLGDKHASLSLLTTEHAAREAAETRVAELEKQLAASRQRERKPFGPGFDDGNL